MTRTNLAVLAAALALAGPARAQFFPSGSGENIAGFTVAGKGAAAAKPNRMEIDLEVTASSELTADAIVKYRDARRRLQEAFAALKLGNVAVEERGLQVDRKGSDMNSYFFDSSPNRKAKAEVQLTRKLVVACTGIREMDEEALLQLVARLLDVAQDAGAKVGGSSDFNPYYYRYNRQSNGLVRFILDDYDALQEQAFQKAIDDARSRARRLAKLGGVELGPVLSAREVTIPGDKPANPYGNGDEGGDDEMPRKRLEASKFQEIPIRVELLVRFEAVAPPKPKPRDGGQ